MHFMSRGTRPAVAVLAGAALALVPSAAFAGSDTTTATPAATSTVAVAGPVGPTSQQGDVHILSPREGQLVSPGRVVVSGTAAPFETVVSDIFAPDGSWSQRVVRDTDMFGRWQFTEDLSALGTYTLGARNFTVTSWEWVTFTVGTPTAPVPPPCEHWWCDKG